MNEIVDLLRNTTHLGRLARHEVLQVIERLEAEGYSIVKKIEAEIALPPVPVPEAEIAQ